VYRVRWRKNFATDIFKRVKKQKLKHVFFSVSYFLVKQWQHLVHYGDYISNKIPVQLPLVILC